MLSKQSNAPSRLLIAVVYKVIIVLGLLTIDASGAVNGRQVQDVSRQQAQRLWEQAIVAKGGRERLHAVENMLLSIRVRARVNLVRSVDLRFEEFYVFPHLAWLYADQSGTVFGMSVETIDRERGLGHLTYPDDPRSSRRTRITPTRENYFFEAQLLYLMESRWLQPRIVAARTERIGFRQVDVVQTIVGQEQVEFYLDRRTHLPIRVVTRTAYEDEGNIEITFKLEDYADVSGIQMPQRVTRIGPLGSELRRVTPRINLDYDRQLFERPPTIEAGPEAWRPRPSSITAPSTVRVSQTQIRLTVIPHRKLLREIFKDETEFLFAPNIHVGGS